MFEMQPLALRFAQTATGWTACFLLGGGSLSAAIGKCSCIGWILEHVGNGRFTRHFPQQLVGLRTGILPAGQQNPVLAQIAHHLVDAAQLLESGKHQFEHMLHLLIRVFDDRPIAETDVAGRQALAISAAFDLGHATFCQTLMQPVQFGFTHRPFEPQEQTVIVQPRVIETVTIPNERAIGRRQIQ